MRVFPNSIVFTIQFETLEYEMWIFRKLSHPCTTTYSVSMDIPLCVNHLIIYRYSLVFNWPLLSGLSEIVFSCWFSYANKVDAQNTEKVEGKNVIGKQNLKGKAIHKIRAFIRNF